RGTCTDSFRITASVSPDLVLSTPFADIASSTMVPESHLFWSAVWRGIAREALARARVCTQRRASRGQANELTFASMLPRSFAEFDTLFSHLGAMVGEYEALSGSVPSAGFTVRVNGLKLAASNATVRLACQALRICGIAGYVNGGAYSVARLVR